MAQYFQLKVDRSRFFAVTVCKTANEMYACATEFASDVSWNGKNDYKGVTFTEDAKGRIGHIVLCEEYLAQPGGLNIVAHELIHATLFALKGRVKYLDAELKGRKKKVNEERVAYLYGNLLSIFLSTMMVHNITVTI